MHRVRVSARRRGGDTDEYLGPSRTPSTRQVERRLPRVSRRSPHLELDALLAHEEVDVARRRPRRRPVAARLPRRRWGARRRHRRRRGDAAEAPRRLADPVLDALEVRAQARLCCYRPVWSVLHVAFFTLGDRDGGVVLRHVIDPRATLVRPRESRGSQADAIDAMLLDGALLSASASAARAAPPTASRRYVRLDASEPTPSQERTDGIEETTSVHLTPSCRRRERRISSPPLHAVDAPSKTKKYHAGGNVRGSSARSRRRRAVLGVPQ